MTTARLACTLSPTRNSSSEPGTPPVFRNNLSRRRPSSWLVLFVSLFLCGFSYPNLFHNQRELQDLKEKINAGREPYLIQYAVVATRAEQAVVPDPGDPSTVYGGRNVNDLRMVMQPQAKGAIYNALVYALGVDSEPERMEAAQKVHDFLLAWALNSLVGVSSISDLCTAGGCERYSTGLQLAVGVLPYVAAYDLVIGSGLLSTSDHAAIEAWLRKVHRLVRETTFLWVAGPSGGGPVLCHRRSNHTSKHISTMAAIGLVLRDAGIAKEALTGTPYEPGEDPIPYYWTALLADQIYMQGQPSIGCDPSNPTHTGEVVDRYRHFDDPGVYNDPSAPPASWNDANRGYGYSLLTTGALAHVAEMVLHFGGAELPGFPPSGIGRDLYRVSGPSGERIARAGKYLAYYKQVSGPGWRTLIPSTGYPGESSYVNEISKDAHSAVFEVLSERYHHRWGITRALRPYDRNGVARRFFDPVQFGKVYDPEELAWEFHLDGIRDGWGWRDAAQVTSQFIRGGRFRFDVVQGDPALEQKWLWFSANEYDTLVVRMRVTPLPGSLALPEPLVTQAFWQNWQGAQGKLSLNYVDDGQVHEYSFPLDSHSAWSGTIKSLRFDPVNRPGARVDLYAIRLQRSSP